MLTIELRNRLIDKIEKTENSALLEEAYHFWVPEPAEGYRLPFTFYVWS